MPADALGERLRAEAAAAGIALTNEQVALLSLYLRLIGRWRRAAGLTAVADAIDAARVHVADSLLCLRAGIASGDSVIDVGSGAGLPGIPLAIVRPDLKVTLLEAHRRKAGFLEMAVRELALPVRVIVKRAEELAQDSGEREQYAVAVARFVAKYRTILELTLPFVRIGGMAIFIKGPEVISELRTADRAREILGGGEPTVSEARLSSGELRRVVVVRKIRTTPPLYPRRPGVPSRRPL